MTGGWFIVLPPLKVDFHGIELERTHNWWFDWDTVGICRYNNNDSKNSQDTNDSNND